MAINQNELQYAGEWTVETCAIATTAGHVWDITDLIASINIYEDLMSNAITGDISLVDTNNLLTNAPIIGQEKLLLKLTTPQDGVTDRSNSIDFVEIPLRIFKVNSKTQINDKTIAYNLGFTTREIFNNNRTRCVASYDGEPSAIIEDILRDEELLNSKKEFYFEPSMNNFRLVAPNMRPFDFINAIARRTLSFNYNHSPTYLFYETAKGYYFRTIESMFDRKNPRMVYKELVPNKLNNQGVIDMAENLTGILNYEVVSTTDTLGSARTGMYGGTLTLIDLFNKDVQNYTYNYLDDFSERIHVDKWARYGSQNAPLASAAQNEEYKRISDYPMSVLHIQTTDRDTIGGLVNAAFDETFDYNGVDQWLLKRKSTFAALNSALTIRVEVPGNPALQVGDMVGLDMRNQFNGTQEDDPYLSGRYLVSRLRHEFTRGDGRYKYSTHMECVRDTIKQPYPVMGVRVPEGGPSLSEEIKLGDQDPNPSTY